MTEASAAFRQPEQPKRGSGSIINVLSMAAAGYFEGLMAYLLRLSPLQRVGSADEIASVAAFLASQESPFITSQIVADGGVIARAFGDPTPRYSRADQYAC